MEYIAMGNKEVLIMKTPTEPCPPEGWTILNAIANCCPSWKKATVHSPSGRIAETHIAVGDGMKQWFGELRQICELGLLRSKARAGDPSAPARELPPTAWGHYELVDHQLSTVRTSAGIDQYTGHELSPYHKVKHSTRKSYDWVHRVLKKTIGKRVLAKITGLDFISWAEKFANAAPGKNARRVARAHDLMSGIRRVLGWGVVLELLHAKRLNDIIGELRFEEPRSRTALFTYEMAKAVIDEANVRSRSSIAMAQALQFETVFRQIDVIGEWVDDMGRSGIRNNAKNTVQPKLWTTGMTWGDISPDLILSKTASKTAKTTRASPSFDLKLQPLVSAEIAKVPKEKRFGPLVINEKTGLPYTQGTFNNIWREIATAAGVPLNVQNRDSRSGGITEGTDAGANLELMRGAAGHSNPSTTARYSRRTLEKTNQVADLRNNWRENKGKNKT